MKALLAAPLALALAGPARAIQDQPDHMVAEGPHFSVLCWFFTERGRYTFAQEIRDVAEGVWSGAGALYGVGAEPLAQRIQLYVYARSASPSFKDSVNGVEPGAATGATSWRHGPSRSAHVKLRPHPTEPVVEAAGVPPDTLWSCALEAARLVQLEASGGAAAPPWFADGSAAWLARQALVAAGRSAPGLESVWFGTRIAMARRMRAEGRLPALEPYLVGEHGDLSAADSEALHTSFFAFLQERDQDLGALWPRFAAGLGAAEAREALRGLLGDAGLLGLEADFHGWLDAQAPLWEEADGAMCVHPDGWIQSPVRPKANAICWAAAPPPGAEYKISGEFQVFLDLKLGRAQANILLGRIGEEFLQLSFHTLSGVSIWSFQPETGVFDMVTSKSWDKAFPARDWVKFELFVADEKLFLTVFGHELIPVNLQGRDMTGQWGLGTFENCTTVWRNVKIEEY